MSDAKDKGASCAIVSKSNEQVDLPQYVCDDTLRAIDELAKYSRSRYTGKVIAITGSYGKTSTREILKLLLGIKNNVPSGNKNGQLGIPMMLCSLSNDEQFAIIEIGVDQIGSIDGLIGMVRPNIGIVTGITKCHMFGFGDEESAANEKCKLIAACSANSGISIFNEDCLRFESFKIYEKNSIVIENSSDNFGPKIKLVGDRYESTIQFMGDIFKFVMPPLMSFGVAQNFMLAATCAMYCGVSAVDIQNRISSWVPYKMRGEVVSAGDRNYFISQCSEICPDDKVLAEIVLDLCYRSNRNKAFAWDVCGAQFVRNLLAKHDGFLTYPTMTENKKEAEFEYYGRQYKEERIKIEL